MFPSEHIFLSLIVLCSFYFKSFSGDFPPFGLTSSSISSRSFLLSQHFFFPSLRYIPSPFNVSLSAFFYLFVLPSSSFFLPSPSLPFNPRVCSVNPSLPLVLLLFLFTLVPRLLLRISISPSWFPCPPHLQPVVFPVSLLIRLSLALVLLIPEGFVYLCWSCFYSLRLTPPIFSPVIWTAGLLCSYSTN